MELLSVIIPAYNEERSIARAISAVVEAAEGAFTLDLIIVDDGSTDQTAAAAVAAVTEHNGRVIQQRNRGRFEARAAGLREARGRYTLFVDSRVRIRPGALAFVAGFIPGEREVWNAHVEIEGPEPYASFWRVLTELAFNEYFSAPRTTTFDLSNFDRFPKGTTCFLAPTEILREAFARYGSRYKDSRHANDDTPIIRWIAATQPINISPSFGCSYRTRTTLNGFVRHAYHRGVVFFDGHCRRDSRFFPVAVSVFPLTVAALVVASGRPRLVPVGVAASLGLPAIVAAGRRRSPGEVAAFAALTPVYLIAHVAGMWKGLALAAGARRSSSTALEGDAG